MSMIATSPSHQRVQIDAWGPIRNPALGSLVIDEEVMSGTQFEWNTGSGTIRAAHLQVERPTWIAWSGRRLGIRAIRVFALTSEGERTRVLTEESYAGIAAWLLRIPIRRMLDGAIGDRLVYLKVRAERRYNDRRGAARESL